MLGTLLLAMPMTAQNVVETDSTGFPQIDTTQIDPLDSIAPASPKKQGLDARVEYTSTDSMVMTGKGIAHMYGNGELKYQALELTAGYIRVCMDSSTLFASGVLDTIVDEWQGLPVFKDANDSYESKEITYNLKTQKGKIRHVVTEQGEGYLIADETKKMEDNTLMLHGGKYTTCDDHEHPHFYLQMTKGKVQPQKNVVFGPAYLVVGEVPLPLAVPFGFFPFTNTYSSGIIMPNFGEDRKSVV